MSGDRFMTWLQVRDVLTRLARDLRRALKRARRWPRAAYLRSRIRSAKADCDVIEVYLTVGPEMLRNHRAQMATWRAELDQHEAC